MDIDAICAELRKGAGALALHTAAQKNHALTCVAQAIQRNKAAILEANAKDVRAAREKGVTEALVERLALDEKKFQSILDGLETIIGQGDPVGEEIAGWTAPKGMQIRQVRVPLGVVGIIYESRPNVTIDAFSLAYKSGNAILLHLTDSNILISFEIVLIGFPGAGGAGLDVPAMIALSPEAALHLAKHRTHRQFSAEAQR